MQGDATARDDETLDGSKTDRKREEAPQVNCPNCDSLIPDEKVATGICPSCWNALPSELDDCYGPGARRALPR